MWLVALMLLAGVLLAGCGNGEDAAAKDPFCAAAAKVDAAKGWHRAQAAAREWRNVGLPDDAPANVRRGFGLGIRLIVSSKGQKQVDVRVRRLTPGQHDDLNAVDDYVADTCPS